MAADEPANGSRFVTHVRLDDVMREHVRDEAAAREGLANRLGRSIDGRARVEEVQRVAADVTRVAGDVSTLETTVGLHDDRWQQMVGMVSLAKIALGSSILSAVAAVVAIAVALR